MSLATFPAVFNEIAEAAGEKAAWTLVQAKGGQELFIPRKVAEGHWLVRLVGIVAAEKICEHFRDNHQSRVLVPQMNRAKMATLLVQALEAGAKTNEAVAHSGAHERTVRRYRRKLRGGLVSNDRQGRLF